MEEVGEVETQLDDDTRCQARVVVEIYGYDRTRDGCDGCEQCECESERSKFRASVVCS